MIVSFDNHEFELADVDEDGLRAVVYREARQMPFYGMYQPTPDGCILGLDAVLELTVLGQPAKRYLWELYEGEECIQYGITDKHGFSRSLEIDMPYDGDKRYNLKIIGPKPQTDSK